MARAESSAGPDAGTAGGGLLFMAHAALWFSVMSLLVKLVGQRIPSIQIVLVRAAISAVLSWALLWRAGVSPWGHRKGLLLLRGLLGFVGLTCFFAAVVHLPLAEVTVIHYTHPLFAALLAAWFLHERVAPRVLVCVLTSLAGVVLIARPAFLFGGGEGGDIDQRFVLVALGAAIFSAAAYVTVRKLGGSEHPLVVVLYFPMVTVPLALPFVVAQWVWPTPLEWAQLLGVGVTTQIAQVSLTKGLAREAAGKATSVGYLQVALATLWGALFFGQLPDVVSIAGIALILVSLLLLTFVPRAARA
jgi:drug/metabolite transporter (DMT)-like permease